MTKITNGDEQIFACMKCNFSGTRQEAFIHATLNMGHGDYIYRSSKGEPPSVEQRIKELLPSDYYADRTVEFRVKMLVESWRRALDVNHKVEVRNTRLNNKLRWRRTGFDTGWFVLIAFALGMLFAEILRHLGI